MRAILTLGGVVLGSVRELEPGGVAWYWNGWRHCYLHPAREGAGFDYVEVV